MCGRGAMTSWVYHPMRSSGELAVELVEVTTLSALSGRKAMRSDTEPGSQGSRTLRFDSNPMMVRKLILIKYLSRSGGPGPHLHCNSHAILPKLVLEVPCLEDLDSLEDLEEVP